MITSPMGVCKVELFDTPTEYKLADELQTVTKKYKVSLIIMKWSLGINSFLLGWWLGGLI